MTDLEMMKCEIMGTHITLFDLYDDSKEVAHFDLSADEDIVSRFLRVLVENGYSFNVSIDKVWDGKFYEEVKRSHGDHQ